MASNATGSSVAIRASSEFQFDPQNGNVLVETWEGTKSQILAIVTGFRALGARIKMGNRGALWTLVATWPNEFGSAPGGGATETPTEKWDIEIEWSQVDIRSSPKFIAAFGGEEAVSKLISSCDQAIKQKQNLTEYYAANGRPAPTADELKAYRLRARGAEGYEIKRPVISRKRTYSENYPQPITVDSVEKVYRTPALISTFNVPPLIQKKLPPDPAQVPAESVWGWRLRKQDGTYTVSRNRVEEVQDWVFAAWSTLLYDVV